MLRSHSLKIAALFLHRLRWLRLPGALLVALLQRTPALRVALEAEEMIAASPVAAVVRALGTAVAALGAVQALAGATQFVLNPNRNPITGTVGAAISPVAFSATGATVPAGSYKIVKGALPPGLTIPGLNANNVLNSSSGQISGVPTTGGNFSISLLAYQFSNAQGDSFPLSPFVIDFTITGGAATGPTITTQPASQTIAAGATVTFTVAATGTPSPNFQWRKNGANLSDGGNISGAASTTLTLMNTQAADTGSYAAVVSNTGGIVSSSTATLAITSPALSPSARLSNLSVRTAMAASQTLIVGVTAGGGAHQVLVRAAGPALTGLGVAGAMVDPRIDGASGTLNDNWDASLSATFSSVGAFAFVNGSKDSALVQNVGGGTSFLVRGTDAGIVLVETYDLGTGTQRLVNVSARNLSGTGDNILIAGFNVAGNGSGAKQLLIRAVGPKLAAFGVSGFLADPKLEVYNTAGVKVTENDDWSASLAPVFASVGAFALDNGSKDAAVLIALPPGGYTAQVKGADGGTGEALIEVYEIP